MEQSINKLLPTMEREGIIATSMTDRAALIHVTDLKQAAEVFNRIAPEHLELSVEDPQAMLDDSSRRRHLHGTLYRRGAG